jgi:hypothetical protein
MAKFGRKNVSLRLSVPLLDAPRRALRNLFQRADMRDRSNLSNLAVFENRADILLRADRQKSLGFLYLEKRKLTLI